MLNTRQKVLRNFWYAAPPVGKLADGPKPFRLLGQDVVLFLAEGGAPAALADRCCHRTARLSKGWVRDGHIVCGYHGWEYDGAGKLRNIPQFPPGHPLPEARATAFRAASATGMSGSASASRCSIFPICPRRAIRASAASTSSTNGGIARRSG